MSKVQAYLINQPTIKTFKGLEALKEAASDIPKSCWETISAFANTNGGWISRVVESTWLKYNQTQPIFNLDFDSTILRLKVEDTDKDTDKDTDLGRNRIEDWGERWGERWGEKWGEKWGDRWAGNWQEIADWWNREINTNLSVNEIKILDMIAVMPDISIVKLAETIGIVETAIENNLKKLKSKEIIQRIGPAKGGRWEIIYQKDKK